MTNEMEVGIPVDGLAPKLVQQFGGMLLGLKVDDRPMIETLRRRLHRLDGDEFGTLIISVQPGTPRNLGDFDARNLEEYIQSAGTAEAMIVEIRRAEIGAFRQYAVGRDVDESGDTTVAWSPDHSETVPATEVFTADQALPVYLQWCWDQTIPDGYHLRLLDI